MGPGVVATMSSNDFDYVDVFPKLRFDQFQNIWVRLRLRASKKFTILFINELISDRHQEMCHNI